MNRLQWRDFEKRARSFFESELRVALLEQMPLPLATGETHKFDLTSSDERIVIECKSHTWTQSGNYPSAKVTDAQRSVELLHKSTADRKIIVFQDDVCPRGSLVEVFVRRNRPLLAGIEVWRLLEGKFEKFVDYSRQQQLTPKPRNDPLEILFDATTKPYFEDQPKAALPAGLMVDRRFRVGIRNKGSAIVHQSRLVLENCEPSESPGVHLGYALQVMGEPAGTGEFSVHPTEVPSVFVDVVYDETLGGGLHGNAFGLCYAARVPSHAILRGPYVLTLRLDGGSTQSRKKFAVDQDPTTGMLRMRELKG
jgi:hypothetical protein